MGKRFKLAMVAAAAVIGSGLAATGASAACGDDSWRKPVVMHGASGGDAMLIRAAAPIGTGGIVGMWSVTFTDTTGAVSDFGYQQFHSDGTEILNSGGRSPAQENFCLGVWRQADSGRYALNHWALSYDPSTGKLNAKVNIQEVLTVSPNESTFAGGYIQDVYDPTGKLIVELKGMIKGQRITP